MRLVNVDNMTYRFITPRQRAALKSAIESGSLRDCCGDEMKLDDVTDGSGDICLDEDAYDDAAKYLQ